MSSKEKKSSSKDKKEKSEKTDKKAGEAKVKKEKAGDAAASADAPAASSSTESGNYAYGIVAPHHILTHFDENTGLAVARPDGNRNNVVPLAEAYKARYNRLREMLNYKILPKREQLLAIQQKLQQSSVAVNEKFKTIERESLLDFEHIVARLKNIESMRQTAIAHSVNEVKAELDTIFRLVNRVEAANLQSETPNFGIAYASAVPGGKPVETVQLPRAKEMVDLIRDFGSLCNDIEACSAHEIKVQIDFPTDDFPRETNERLEIISRCDRYVHALAVKDQMLWTLMQEKSIFEEKIHEEQRLNSEYAEEVANWAMLSDQMSKQIASLKAEKEAVERRNRELQTIMRKNNIYFDQI